MEKGTLESLGKGCQKLKYLELGNCTGLDDYGVIALVQNCHDLEYLQLHSKNISSSSLHEISHFCSNLFHLEIDGYNVNAASVESLLTEHRFIKYVSIRSCCDHQYRHGYKLPSVLSNGNDQQYIQYQYHLILCNTLESVSSGGMPLLQCF
jgi:hypothetical protein